MGVAPFSEPRLCPLQKGLGLSPGRAADTVSGTPPPTGLVMEVGAGPVSAVPRFYKNFLYSEKPITYFSNFITGKSSS